MKTQIFNHATDALFWPQKNWVTDFLIDQLGRCTNHHLVVAFGEDDAFSSSTNLVDDVAHDGIGLAETSLELLTVFLDREILRLDTSHALINSRLSNGRSLPKQHSTIEWFGDDVIGTILHDCAVVSR